MSEHLQPRHHEKIHHTPEASTPQEVQHHTQEQVKDGRHHLKEQVEHIAHKAKHEAISTSEYHAHHQEKAPHQPSHVLVNTELKSMALKRTLTRVRKDLPAPARSFSKIVHQPAVDALSEVGSKTVGRPSGILTGGVVALLGTSLVLYFSKHYGYEYNFLLFALFFVGGFVLGLFIELAIYIIRRPHRL